MSLNQNGRCLNTLKSQTNVGSNKEKCIRLDICIKFSMNSKKDDLQGLVRQNSRTTLIESNF